MSFHGVGGGGDIGEFLQLTVTPDSALVTQITNWKTAGTNAGGKLVKFVTSGNLEVTVVGNDEIPEAEILKVEEDMDSTYVLTVKVFGYTDAESAYHARPHYKVFAYNGTIALGNQVLVNGAGCDVVDGIASGGHGKVVMKDEPEGYVGVLW